MSVPSSAVWTTIPNMQHAQVMCDAVRKWYAKQSEPKVDMDWQAVSASLKRKGVLMSATSCHILWKYLAYGIVISKNSDQSDALDESDQVDIESDEDDYFTEPQVASLAFHIDSLASSTLDDHVLHLSASPRCSLSSESLCAMVVARSVPPPPPHPDKPPQLLPHHKKTTVASHPSTVFPVQSAAKSTNKLATVKPVSMVTCPSCSRSYAQDRLRMHQQRMHPVECVMEDMLDKVARPVALPKASSSKLSTCKYCNEYLSRVDMIRHLESVHPVENIMNAMLKRIQAKAVHTNRIGKAAAIAETERLAAAAAAAAAAAEKRKRAAAARTAAVFPARPLSSGRPAYKKKVAAKIDFPNPHPKSVIAMAAEVTDHHCPACKVKFSTSRGLSNHMLETHSHVRANDVQPSVECSDSETFTCSLCLARLISLQSFSDHMKSNHPQELQSKIKALSSQGKVNCPHCAKSLLETGLKGHIKRQHSDIQLCPISSNSFSGASVSKRVSFVVPVSTSSSVNSSFVVPLGASKGYTTLAATGPARAVVFVKDTGGGGRGDGGEVGGVPNGRGGGVGDGISAARSSPMKHPLTDRQEETEETVSTSGGSNLSFAPPSPGSGAARTVVVANINFVGSPGEGVASDNCGPSSSEGLVSTRAKRPLADSDMGAEEEAASKKGKT